MRWRWALMKTALFFCINLLQQLFYYAIEISCYIFSDRFTRILFRFNKSFNMGDLEYCHTRSIMSEIMTVDKNSKHLLVNALHQSSINPSLPKFSTPRIYREDGCTGTGFIVGFNSEGPLLLTAKHVAMDCFTETSLQCFVCFHESQINYPNRIFYRSHQCGILYSLELLAIASELFDEVKTEQDPITHENYGVKFDAAIFLIKSVCICGRGFPLPIVNSIKLKEIPSSDIKISIIGYMGQLSTATAPLIDLSNQDLSIVQTILHAGVLSESKGEIDSIGDMFAISCPTTAGFSGSPAIYEGEDGEIYAWGVFVGGPALEEHNILLRIANAFIKDKVVANKLICDLSDLDFPNKSSMLIELENGNLINYLKEKYLILIRQASISGKVSQESLNHNLVLPLRRIKGFLANYGISFK